MALIFVRDEKTNERVFAFSSLHQDKKSDIMSIMSTHHQKHTIFLLSQTKEKQNKRMNAVAVTTKATD